MFSDIRTIDDEVIWQSKDGSMESKLTINPDIICSVTNLPFEDNTFYHVVLDPPHLLTIGDKAWIYKKYGRLDDDWKEFMHDAFVECMRVLKPNGTLVFKWSEVDIKLKELLSVIPQKPLYGYRSGKHMTTHWMVFIK